MRSGDEDVTEALPGHAAGTDEDPLGDALLDLVELTARTRVLLADATEADFRRHRSRLDAVFSGLAMLPRRARVRAGLGFRP